MPKISPTKSASLDDVHATIAELTQHAHAMLPTLAELLRTELIVRDPVAHAQASRLEAMLVDFTTGVAHWIREREAE